MDKPPVVEEPREQDQETAPVSKIDGAYGTQVSRYFKEYKKMLGEGEDSADEFSYEQAAAEEQRSLEALANSDKAAGMSAKDVSLALADIVGQMGKQNPEIPENLTGDKKIDAEHEKQFAAAKKIFIDSCKKIFPKTRADFHSGLEGALAGLTMASDATMHLTSIDGMSSQEILKMKPQEAAAQLNRLLSYSGEILQSAAFEGGHKEKDMKKRDNVEKELAVAVEAIYRIQLMRDQLQKEIYGRSDIASGDAKKIDTVRNDIKTEEAAPDLKASKEKVSFAKDTLEKGLGKSLQGLGFKEVGNDPKQWAKMADGLEEIRRAWSKDKRAAFQKSTEFEGQIKKFFGTL